MRIRVWLFAPILLAVAGVMAVGYFTVRSVNSRPERPESACDDQPGARGFASWRHYGKGANQSEGDACRASGPDTSGESPTAFDPATANGRPKPGDEPTRKVDLDTLKEPVAGYLLVHVVRRDDQSDIVGAMVYLPVLEWSLPVDNGDIRLTSALKGLGRRTNRYGVAAWTREEIATAMGESTGASVLVTSAGFVDLFEPLKLPDVRTRGAVVKFSLYSAVSVRVKTRLKRGGIAPEVPIEVLQTCRQGETNSPRNAFSITSDFRGEVGLRVADEFLYQFTVKAAGYAPYASQVFDFKHGEREVSIVLEVSNGMAGIVRDVMGTPVKGAQIAVVGENVGATTDADGRFDLQSLRDAIFSNEFTLRVTAQGFAPALHKALMNDRDVQITLEKGAIVGGTVIDAKKKPVEGATVTCTYNDATGNHALPAVQSGPEGVFSFTGLPRGQATLVARLGTLTSSAQTVNVDPARDLAAIELVIDTGATIRGTVLDDAKQPVKGATVELNGDAKVLTDEKGAFSFVGLQPGEHRVRIVNTWSISEPGLASLPLFTADGKQYYYLPVQQKVKTELGQSATANFEARRFEIKTEREITVHVVGDAADESKGIVVRISADMGKPPKGVQRPQPVDQTFDLTNGVYDLKLKLVDGLVYEALFNHRRYFPAKLSPDAFAGVPDGGLIELQLQRAFIVKGYVKDSDGNGLEGVGISQDKRNAFNFSTTTDIHGYFEIGQLNQGDYLFSAFKVTYYLEQVQVRVQGRDPDPLQIQLVGANEIRLIVMNNGSRQAGARVHVYRAEVDGNNPDLTRAHFDIGTTDAQGVKFINFHWLRNYQVVVLFEERIACINFDNLRDVPSREFTLYMEPAHKLVGRVVDATSNQPVPDATLCALIEPTGSELHDNNLFQTRSDGAGNFAMTVPNGDFHFFVPKSRIYQRLDTSGEPVRAGAVNIVLKLVPRDDIEGNWAQVTAFVTPLTMEAGQEYQVTVTVRNAGSTTWGGAGKKAWRLGSQAPQDNKTWGFGRVNLPVGVQVLPGDSYTFTFNVKAPAQAGTYPMQWRMVQEHVEWFGDYTSVQNVVVNAPAGG